MGTVQLKLHKEDAQGRKPHKGIARSHKGLLSMKSQQLELLELGQVHGQRLKAGLGITKRKCGA